MSTSKNMNPEVKTIFLRMIGGFFLALCVCYLDSKRGGCSAIKNTCFPCFYIRWNMGLNTPGAADLLADLSYIDC